MVRFRNILKYIIGSYVSLLFGLTFSLSHAIDLQCIGKSGQISPEHTNFTSHYFFHDFGLSYNPTQIFTKKSDRNSYSGLIGDFFFADFLLLLLLIGLSLLAVIFFRFRLTTATKNRELSIFRTLYEKIPAGIIMLEGIERLLYVNKFFLHSTGYSKNELIPLHRWLSISKPENHSPEAIEKLVQDIEHFCEKNQDSTYCFSGFILLPDKRYLPAEVKAFCNGKNNLIFLFNVMKPEKEYREFPENHSEILEPTVIPRDLWCYADLNGIILKVNNEWKRVLGNNQIDYTGRSLLDLVHPEDLSSTTNFLKALRKFSEISGFINRIQKSDGDYLFLEWSARTDGQFFHAVCREITRKILWEMILENIEDKYHLVADDNFEIVWVYNYTHEKFVFISPSIRSLTGITSNVILHKPLGILLAPESEQYLRNKINILCTDNAPTDLLKGHNDKFEILLKSNHNHAIPIKVKAAIHCYKNIRGEWEIIGIFRKFHEENSQKEFELRTENLEDETDSWRNKIFSVIAHDLQSPLSNVLGFGELLKSEADNFSYTEIKDIGRMIYNVTCHALNLLQSLLHWAAVKEGTARFNPRYLLLHDLVNDVFTGFSEASLQKKIGLLNKVPDDMMVTADEKMLHLILRNLVSNGIKYSYTGGTVSVEAKILSEVLYVEVIDEGIGIAEHDRERLFQQPVEYSTPGTQLEKGSGLGLVICRYFVEYHGGKIWVEPRTDRGSRFIFTLPGQKSENQLSL